jgi:SAM-dependent methyltransferase
MRAAAVTVEPMIYEGVNHQVLTHMPRGVRSVLDVGCGAGELGRKIKEKMACRIVGITCSEAEAGMASQRLDEVLVRDLNDFDASEVGQFDCVICSHVLEHIYQPDQLLKRLSRSLAPGGTLIVALPNVLHWRQRLEFLMGRFKYTEGGLMDRTHYRFFDWATARELLTGSGYAIVEAEAHGAFPLSRFLSRLGGRLDRAALKRFPGLFGFQFVFICNPDSSTR